MNILQALDDPQLFGGMFRAPPSWSVWRAVLAALFGLPMTPDQLALYRQCTGREAPPAAPFTESWLVVGRRGGKSRILALVAVFLACFFDWRSSPPMSEVSAATVSALFGANQRPGSRRRVFRLNAQPSAASRRPAGRYARLEGAERQARELAVACASNPVPGPPGANWGEAMAERDRQLLEDQKRLDAHYEAQERAQRERAETEKRFAAWKERRSQEREAAEFAEFQAWEAKQRGAT